HRCRPAGHAGPAPRPVGTGRTGQRCHPARLLQRAALEAVQLPGGIMTKLVTVRHPAIGTVEVPMSTARVLATRGWQPVAPADDEPPTDPDIESDPDQ